MARKFTVVLEKDGAVFTARCLEIDLVSQGKTPGAALDNAREAIGLYVEQNPKFKPKQVELAVVEV
ncbi:MAG: type II toxin-antitoxin system HicB family antitoxin [Nanoarchaeota archaeon]